MSKKSKKKIENSVIYIIAIILLTCAGYFNIDFEEDTYNEKDTYITEENNQSSQVEYSFDINNIPEYTSDPYVYINNNMPDFSDEDMNLDVFESYSELDNLGRCGVAFAKVRHRNNANRGKRRNRSSKTFWLGYGQI